MKKLMSLMILVSSLMLSTLALAQNPTNQPVNSNDPSNINIQGAAVATADCKEGACLQNMPHSQVIGKSGIEQVNPDRYDQFLPGNDAPAQTKPGQGSKGTD